MTNDSFSNNDIKCWFKTHRPNDFTDEELIELLDDNSSIMKKRGNKDTYYHGTQLRSHMYFNNEKGAWVSNKERYRSRIKFSDYADSYNNSHGQISKMKHSGTYFYGSICGLIPIRAHFDIDKLTNRFTEEEITTEMKSLFSLVNCSITKVSIAECVKTSSVKDASSDSMSSDTQTTNTQHITTYGYHIVIPEVSLTFETLDLITKYFNTKCSIEYSFDESICHGARLFRMPMSINKDKPNPYLLINNDINDWDLANTSSCTVHLTTSDVQSTITFDELIDKRISTQILNSSKTNYNDFSKQLKINRLSNKYNTDHVLFGIKYDLLNSIASSPVSTFELHASKHGYIDGQYYMSSFVFIQNLYYTLYTALEKQFTNTSTMFRRLLLKTFEDVCNKFDKFQSQNSRKNGSLIDQSKRIDLTKTVDDCYLYKFFKSTCSSEYQRFISYLNNREGMHRHFLNENNDFILSDYTFDDYIEIHSKLKTYDEHVSLLRKTVAFISSIMSFAFKRKNSRDGRNYYDIISMNDLNRFYQRKIKVYLGAGYHKETSCIDITNEDDDEVKKDKKSSHLPTLTKTFTLQDFLTQDLVCSCLCMYRSIEPFHDITFDFDEHGAIIDRDKSIDSKILQHSNKEVSHSTLTFNVSTPEPIHNVYDMTHKYLSNFVPPAKAEYDQRLAQEWIRFMMSRIRPKYHNAFIDFLYSVRYRLISGDATPAKCYISYGKYGGEGKSFLHGCMKQLFGNDAFMVISKEQFVNEKFNEYKARCGFLSIEEAEGSTANQVNTKLSTAIKLTTTKDGALRPMGKTLTLSTNYAILAINTNQAKLDGLIYSEPAVIDRLVILNFKKSDLSEQDWAVVKNTFTSNRKFAYSLWRYLISNISFVANEGKGYTYNLERYYGQEKYDYVNKAKNKLNTIIKEVYSKLRFIDERVDQLVPDIEDEDETNVQRILRYDAYLHIAYVDLKTLEVHVADMMKEHTTKKITKSTIDEMMIHNGWEYNDYIKLSDNTHIKGYKKQYSEDVVDVRDIVDDDSHENDVIEKDTIIKSFLKGIITNHLKHCGEKYSYIEANKLKNIHKEFNKNITKKDVIEYVDALGFSKNSISATIDKKSKTIYKYRSNRVVSVEYLLKQLEQITL